VPTGPVGVASPSNSFAGTSFSATSQPRRSDVRLGEVAASEFPEVLDRYRQLWRDSLMPGAESFWVERAAPGIVTIFESFLERHPELQDYPFLDPVGDRPSDPLALSAFGELLASEQEILHHGMYWQDYFDSSRTSGQWARDYTLQWVSDYEKLAGIPPSVLASTPWFGDVPHERIVQELPLLQALRLEYFDEILPLLLEYRLARGWKQRLEHSPESLPEEYRLDVVDYLDDELARLGKAMEPYRARYLRAVGEAIGATELPPID